MREQDLVGALTSHYPTVVQRSLISGNITTQDRVNLLWKLDALEAQGDYRNPKLNSKIHDASRRPQYNSQGDRKQRDSIQVQYVQYADGSSYDMRVYPCR